MQIYILFTLMVGSHFLYAQNGINLVKFSTGYNNTILGLENCGDSRLFVVQKSGQIMICDATGKKLSTPYLDISDRIHYAGTSSSEQGLLGLTFDPHYITNGFFYVFYTDKNRDIQISRFQVSSTNRNKANPLSEKKILSIVKDHTYHNGGQLGFGPDGYLYIGIGDGGGERDPQNHAQNPGLLLGKMLRIDVHSGTAPYKIPPTNPFINKAGYRPEIWAIGLRNPWRWSFDKVSGALIIGDVGQDAWEEVDFQRHSSTGGENYGWRCYEGNHPFNTDSCKAKANYTAPVFEYAHSDVTGACCIIGGFVYRGAKFPSMYHRYYFTDFCNGIIRSGLLDGNITTVQDEYDGDDFAYTSFGEGNNGELYVVNQADGSIYHLVATSAATTPAPSSVITLSVYPNPARHYCTISYTTAKAEDCTIDLFNAMGMHILTEKHVSIAGKNNWQLAIPANLKSECYITVTSASGTRIRQNILIK